MKKKKGGSKPTPPQLRPELSDIAFSLNIFDNTLDRSINNCIDFKMKENKKKCILQFDKKKQ